MLRLLLFYAQFNEFRHVRQPLVISHIDAAVEETDWLLQRLKGHVSLHLAEEKFCRRQSGSETDEDSKFHKKRKKIESAWLDSCFLFVNGEFKSRIEMSLQVPCVLGWGVC